MKKRMFLTAVLGLLMVGLVSCNKNEEIPDDSDTDQNGLTSGQWVDMGLPSGLRWASYNLGASKPEGYGDYYAWGDEIQHDVYDWNTYRWSTANSSGGLNELTKYNTKALYGTVDNKQVIESHDDAASVYWGDGARIPTKYEWDELLENSTCQWTEINGVGGRKFTSRINGNSIFFPAAGIRMDASRSSAGESGRYWSSTLKSNDPTDAYHLYFGQYGFSIDEDCSYRCWGVSVRAVKEF